MFEFMTTFMKLSKNKFLLKYSFVVTGFYTRKQ